MKQALPLLFTEQSSGHGRGRTLSPWLQSAGQWGPIPGLVSGPGASVVNRGWTDAGLPPGSLVDKRQLASSTALTMYPSLATDPWPQTIPTAYSVSGMISPPLEAPVRKAGMRAVFGTLILGTGKKVRHLLSLTNLVSAPSH